MLVTGTSSFGRHSHFGVEGNDPSPKDLGSEVKETVETEQFPVVVENYQFRGLKVTKVIEGFEKEVGPSKVRKEWGLEKRRITAETREESKIYVSCLSMLVFFRLVYLYVNNFINFRVKHYIFLHEQMISYLACWVTYRNIGVSKTLSLVAFTITF